MVGKTKPAEPIVAEMEEATASDRVAQDLGLTGLNSMQTHHDDRLVVLEQLRDRDTPIELDFNLQKLTQAQLRAARATTSGTSTVGVTAIAPGRARGEMPRPSHHLPSSDPITTAPSAAAAESNAPRGDTQPVADASTGPLASTARNVHRLVFSAAPAVRSSGRYLGHCITCGAAAALRAVRRSASRVGHVSASAGRVVRGTAVSSASAVAAAARATGGAVAAAAAQPARLGRAIKGIPVRGVLRRVLGPVRSVAGRVTGFRDSTRRRASAQDPGTPPAQGVAAAAAAASAAVVAPAATGAKGGGSMGGPATAAVPSTLPAPSPAADGEDHLFPFVLRAQPLSQNQSYAGSRRRGGPRPYVAAMATPVPALLIPEGPDVVGSGGRLGNSGRPSTTSTSAPNAPGDAASSAKRKPASRRRPLAAGGADGGGRGRPLAAAAGLIARPLGFGLAAAKAAVVTAKYGATALLCAFFPKSCRVLGLAALLSGPTLPLLPAGLAPRNPLYDSSRLLRGALAPLAPLRGPFAAFAGMRLVGPLVAPSVWRNVMYWQRTVPIVTRYVLTGRRAAALSARGEVEAAAELWQRQHEWGAAAIFDMLADLKGFYLKLGQILASKTDMLPQPYTESLSRLLDRLPPAPYRAVRRTIKAELGAPPELLFRELDPFPLASATIAQVHRGSLPDGRPVVVKVQHGPARRMMRSDLANLAALSGLVEAAGLRLGFDHQSLVREYNVQVPLEFDFAREARVASSIRASLERASATFPALRRVVVPRMVASHSTRRVLTMEYLDGVPLLDIAHMDRAVRHDLMTSLILAYGVMILRDGLFHSDPHPGNVLAMRRRPTSGPLEQQRTSFGVHRTSGAGAGGGVAGALAALGAGVNVSVSSGSSAAPPSALDLVMQHPGSAGGGAGGLPSHQGPGGHVTGLDGFAGGGGGQFQNPLFQLHEAYEMGLAGGVPPELAGAAAAAAAAAAAGGGLSDTDDLQVALLDFGQAKQLSPASRARYALLVAAMAVRDDELVLAVSAELGLVVDNCSPEFAAVASYILFDTRMDFPEAHMGPMDPQAHEFRTAKVPSLPQDLFMIMRSITLLRGLLSSLEVDISSAQLWRPLALQVLADLTPIQRGPGFLLPSASDTPDPAALMAADLAEVVPLDFDQAAAAYAAVGGPIIDGALPSPAVAAAVLAAASRPAGAAARASGSRGSAGGVGSPRAADNKAAAEAARRAEKAERDAAEAERKRLAREAAAAARREEEARRKAEWEETMRRKREEQEAKAARLRALKAEAEAKKAAERAEREARKRAEIEASNARRQAEREAAEARRRAEKEAAEAARKQRSRSSTPSRRRGSNGQEGPAAPPSPTLPPPPLGGAFLGSLSAAGPRPADTTADAPAATAVPGVIHSPMPVRFAPVPYSALSGGGGGVSRLAQAGGPAAGGSGSGRYGGAAADGGAHGHGGGGGGFGGHAAAATGDISLHDAALRASPSSAAAAAAQPPLSSVVRAGSPLTTFRTPSGHVPAAHLHANPQTVGSSRFAPPTPPRVGAAASNTDGDVDVAAAATAAGSAVVRQDVEEFYDVDEMNELVSTRRAPPREDDLSGTGAWPNGRTAPGDQGAMVVQPLHAAATSPRATPLQPTSVAASSPAAINATYGMAPGAGLRIAPNRSTGGAGSSGGAPSPPPLPASATETSGPLPQSPLAAEAASAAGGAATNSEEALARVQLQQLELLQAQLQQRLSPGGGAAVPLSSPGAGRPAGQGTAAELDIYAQARALLESTRKLVPAMPSSQAGPNGGGGGGGGGGAQGQAAAANGATANGPTVVQPSSPSVASGDSLVSRRGPRNGSTQPSTMFLPPGMRTAAPAVGAASNSQVSGGAGASVFSTAVNAATAAVAAGGGNLGGLQPVAAAAVPAVGSVSVGGGFGGGGGGGGSPLNLTSATNVIEIEPAPGSAPRSGGAAGAGVFGGGGDGAAGPSSFEMAAGGGAGGGVGVSGDVSPVAGRSTVTAVDVAAIAASAAAAAAGGGVAARTGDSGFPTGTEEDYSMWVARQQQQHQQRTSILGSDLSTNLALATMTAQQQQQQQQQTSAGASAAGPGAAGGLTAQGLGVGPSPLPPTVFFTAADPPTTSGVTANSGGVSGGVGSGGAGGVSGGGVGSGGKPSPGGKATSTASSASSKSGVGAVKQGLSRIGRKIVGGLTSP